MPPLRILVITNFFFPDKAGGQGRIAYDLARAYVSLGHEVWFLAQAIDENAPPYRSEEGFHALRYFVKRSPLIDPRLHTKHVLAAEKILTEFFPGVPDIVHGHDLLPYIAALKKYEKESCFYYTIHSPAVEELHIVWKSQGIKGSIKRALGLPIIRRLERTALERSQSLEAKSQFTRSLVQKHYGSKVADRIQIIPGWVDTRRFHPLDMMEQLSARQQLGWPVDKPILFSLRRLEPRMGLDNYLHALAIVKQRGYEFLAIIGGTGNLKDHLTGIVSKLHLSEHVRFMGYIADEVLPLAYGACDASIVPTVALEGFGIITLEGLACGKPVLATPVGALPEVVGAFEPSWLAESTEPSALANIICDFLDGKLPFDFNAVMSELADYSFTNVTQTYQEWLKLT